MTETALAAKLKEKGIMPRNVRLDMALAEFRNNAGTFSEGLERLCAAFNVGSMTRTLLAEAVQGFERDIAGRFVAFTETGSAGHHVDAEHGQLASADASRTNESEGRARIADKATAGVPSLSTNRNGAGHSGDAEAAHAAVPRPVSTMPRRGIEAIKLAAKAVEQTRFDAIVLPDGRKLADIPWHELPKVASVYRRISRIAMLIYHHAQPVDQSATSREMLKEAEFNNFIEQAERFNDIV